MIIRIVSIRHQPEYLPSHVMYQFTGFNGCRIVSIRHQPEYLPSRAGAADATDGTSAFQSGISLSICLHWTTTHLYEKEEVSCVSIRHQPEYLPSPVARLLVATVATPHRFNQASA